MWHIFQCNFLYRHSVKQITFTIYKQSNCIQQIQLEKNTGKATISQKNHIRKVLHTLRQLNARASTRIEVIHIHVLCARLTIQYGHTNIARTTIDSVRAVWLKSIERNLLSLHVIHHENTRIRQRWVHWMANWWVKIAFVDMCLVLFAVRKQEISDYTHRNLDHLRCSIWLCIRLVGWV